MSGTEWTEPGQGATVADLWYAVLNRGPGNEVARAKAARAIRRKHGDDDAGKYTNLRLTGAPLTADDLKRIAEAK